MIIISKPADLREKLTAIRREGLTVGFVPTMGSLHAGHMRLVERAKSENDVVVVSIFVNPLQFGPGEDFKKYPRDLTRDSAMLEASAVDYLFAPGVEDMYPKPMQTIIGLPGLGCQLEGAVRPGHFAGVATVVTKLFNIVQPQAAYFGEKDYQQVAIIQRMTDDLSLPVRIVAVPTIREHDGLACSSRNAYLTESERHAASVIPRALEEAERLLHNGLNVPAELETALTEFISREPLAVPEIVAIRDAETLAIRQELQDGPILVFLYVRIGTTRLLDNRVFAKASPRAAAG